VPATAGGATVMLGKLCTICLGKYVHALAATRGLMCGVDLFEGKNWILFDFAILSS
jgi:hypothetical protein